MVGPSAFDQDLEILGLLGKGGFGSVHRARHRRLDREVAVKLLDPHLIENDSEKERFVREARTMAELSHPGLLKVLDAGEHGDAVYFTMELATTRTLYSVMGEAGKMPPAVAIPMILELLDVLDYLRARSVVHRDIKPANIFAEPGAQLKLGDFGISLSAAFTERLTRTGMMIGTLAYMAPELVSGGAASPATDLYSAGAVLYEMLTAKRIWGKHSSGVVIMPGMVKVTPAKLLAPLVSDELSDLLERWLANDPAERAGDVEIREALERMVAAPPPPPSVEALVEKRSTAKKPGPPVRPAEPTAQPSRPWAIAGVGLAVLVVALVAPRPAPPPPPPAPSSASPTPAPPDADALLEALEKTAIGSAQPSELAAAGKAFMDGDAKLVREIAARQLERLSGDEPALAAIRESAEAGLRTSATGKSGYAITLSRACTSQFVSWTRRVRFQGLVAALADPTYSTAGGMLGLDANAKLHTRIVYDRTGFPRLRDAIRAIEAGPDIVATETTVGWHVRMLVADARRVANNQVAQKWIAALQPEVDALTKGWLDRMSGRSGTDTAARLSRVLALAVQLSGGTTEQRAQWKERFVAELVALRDAGPIKDRLLYDRLLDPNVPKEP